MLKVIVIIIKKKETKYLDVLKPEGGIFDRCWACLVGKFEIRESSQGF